MGVAERLRRQVVALENAGSNPAVHPNAFEVRGSKPEARVNVEASARAAGGGPIARPTQRMRTPVRLSPLFLAALVLTAACLGGGEANENERLAGVLRGMIIAALAGDPADTQSYPGALPPDLPARPPLYLDATLIGSTLRLGPPPEDPSAQGRLALYFIALDTPDARQDVFAYYEEALDKAPWRLEASATVPDVDRLDFSNRDDLDISGIVQIVPGEDGGATTILISLQDAGARIETSTVTPEPRLPKAVPTPGRFPEDVPVPPDAVATSAAYQRSSESESFLLVLVTEDPPEEVAAFYDEAFDSLGWKAQPGESVANEERRSFEDAAGGLTGELVIEPWSDDPRLTEIDLRVRRGDQPDRGTPTAGPD